MIEMACKEMEASGKIRLLRTSNLWETKAMYVLDQDKFVNGVCEVDTTLSPLELLDELQSIENRMGRVKFIDKGPRNIDLDILLYDEETVVHERLQIPHPLMLEREFVLRPLCDIAPKKRLLRPKSGTFLQSLRKLAPSNPPLSPFTPLARALPPIATTHPNRATRIMSILNVTPDSFSDAGKNYEIDESELARTIKSHIAAGATIIDIGGQSTRPGAIQITSNEEVSRILPVIKIIRSLREAENIAISVDTYHAEVAKHAIEAGADIINDVSAGQMDPEMLPTVAQLGCTVCLMHMRGTPATMNSHANYSPNGVLKTVAEELRQRVEEAEKAGVRRWRIILDPGIGFAKTQDHNLELLHRLEHLRHSPALAGLPWLVGTSRKAFIGKITGVDEAEKRAWGTAAAVTAAIQGGADIVRVHDVEEMTQVARMADALYRVEGWEKTVDGKLS